MSLRTGVWVLVKGGELKKCLEVRFALFCLYKRGYKINIIRIVISIQIIAFCVAL
jgi:hypothetical protein